MYRWLLGQPLLGAELTKDLASEDLGKPEAFPLTRAHPHLRPCPSGECKIPFCLIDGPLGFLLHPLSYCLPKRPTLILSSARQRLIRCLLPSSGNAGSDSRHHEQSVGTWPPLCYVATCEVGPT
jgi:hypothetical protein